MSREVAAELVGDLLHERDLVAEAFRRCHDVTPPVTPMRVSPPVTLLVTVSMRTQSHFC